MGLVVLIWGTLIYNFVSWSDNTEYLVSEDYMTLPINQKDYQAPRDTFDILLDWSDPFKVGSSRRQSSGTGSATSSAGPLKKKHNRPAPPPIPDSKEDKKKPVFPQVTYQGYSINDSQITRVRVKVGEKTKTLKLNECYEDMTLTAMTKDSIALYWNGERKVILRERGY